MKQILIIQFIEVKLQDATIEKTSFQNTVITGTDFSKASMIEVDLSNAIIKEQQKLEKNSKNNIDKLIKSSELSDSDFSNIVLNYRDFSESKLNNSDFSN